MMHWLNLERQRLEHAYQEQEAMEVPGSEAPEAVPQVGDGTSDEIFQPPEQEKEPQAEGVVPSHFRTVGDFDSLQIVPPHPDESFWSPGSTAAGAHTLSYHGGPTCHVPKLFLIYAGYQGDRAQLEQFAHDLMQSGYLSGLDNYGSGNGQFLGSYTYPGTAPALVDDNSWVRPFVSWVLGQPGVPQPDMNTLYAVLFGPNTTVQLSGESSCSQFCGYHGSLSDGRTIYLVLPDTSCSPCHGPNSPTDALQMVLSHEVAEAASNPFGSGWYEDSTGMENADICAWPIPPPHFGPYVVQGYYTNEQGCFVGDYQPVQQPPPQPPPGPPPPQPPPTADPRIDALVAWQGRVTEWAATFPKQ